MVATEGAVAGAVLEGHTIAPIPLSERLAAPRDLFTIGPFGRVVAELARVGPGGDADPEVLICALDYGRCVADPATAAAGLRKARRPELYAEPSPVGR